METQIDIRPDPPLTTRQSRDREGAGSRIPPARLRSRL